MCMLIVLDCRNLMLQNMFQSWLHRPTGDVTRTEESSSTDTQPVMNVNTFREDGKYTDCMQNIYSVYRVI